MTKKLLLIVFIIFFTGSISVADKNIFVQDFALKDYQNKEYKLSDFTNSKAVVLIFISTRCPWSNAYNERIAALAGEYSEKNIQFLSINSNQLESIEEIKNHSMENNFTFPVLKDTNNIAADLLHASVTPEVYVLGPNRQVLYHGRIDNSRDESQVTTKDLKNTLEEILRGEKVSVTETKAFGCSIKRSS